MAKKKWKNLRDTFIKELKKIPKPRSGADADNEPKYTGTWPYFESMSFLIVILKPRKTEGNIVPETDSNSRDLSESTDADGLEDDLAVDVADSDYTQLHESMSTLQEMPQNTTTGVLFSKCHFIDANISELHPMFIINSSMPTSLKCLAF